jgi:hypothetical protein
MGMGCDSKFDVKSWGTKSGLSNKRMGTKTKGVQIRYNRMEVEWNMNINVYVMSSVKIGKKMR